jgi:hypothetical protein
MTRVRVHSERQPTVQIEIPQAGSFSMGISSGWLSFAPSILKGKMLVGQRDLCGQSPRLFRFVYVMKTLALLALTAVVTTFTGCANQPSSTRASSRSDDRPFNIQTRNFESRSQAGGTDAMRQVQ